MESSPAVPDHVFPTEVLDLILAGYWDWNIPENTEYLSPAFKQMFGYEDHELPNRPESWQKLIFPEDLPATLENFHRHVESRGREPFYQEVRYRHRDGSTVWVICSGKVIEWSDEGEPLRMVGCHVDITQIRQQQMQVEQLSLVAANTTNGVIITDAEGHIEWVNASFTRMMGYSLEEVRGRKPGEILQGPKTESAVVARIRAALEAGQLCEETLLNYAKDGRTFNVLMRIDPVRNPQGQIINFIAIQTDVTEQLRREKLLRESEARLHDALEASGDGVWDYYPETQRLLLSSRCKAMLGYGDEEIGDTLEDWEQLVHPADLEEVRKDFWKHVATETAMYRSEYRLRCKDGSYLWVLDRGRVLDRDESGQAIRVIGTHVDISERKDMEQALRASEEKFRGIFELAPVGLAFNDLATGQFIDANQSLLDSVGYTKEALVSLTYRDITPREYEAQEEDHFRSLLTHKCYGPYQKEYIHRSGRRFPVLLNGMILYDENGREMICSIVQDISEIKRIEEDLREAVRAQRAARALLEAAGRIARVGHWEVIDGSPTVFWSDVTCQIHEVAIGTRPDLETALGFYGEEDRPQIAAIVQRSREIGVPFEFEANISTATGNFRWVHSRGEPVLDENGSVIGLRGVFQDIDERRKAEELLQRRNLQLEIATERAEAHSRAKAEFLANMSHEIRTPLNAVIGMSELLRDENLGEQEREFVETIHHSGDMLLGIINDILDFSKIESGRLDLEEIPIDIRECLESALDIVAPQAAKKQIELLAWVDEAVPTTIMGDAVRLRQILVNLAANAIKFTSEGEVFIKLSCRIENGGSILYAEVRDTGIGIPRERQDKLFQAFSQVDSSTTRRYGGTGLGLAISRRLVEMMRGRIWVESEVGKGSNFQFELPIRRVDGPDAKPVRSLEGVKVLISGSRSQNRAILRMSAESWKMEAVLSESPAEAMERIRKGESFDLAIFDLGVSVNSEELIDELRRSDASMSLLLLTSRGTERGRNAKAPGILLLNKPVKSGMLFNACSRLLGRGHETHGLANGKPEDHALAETCPQRVLVAEDNLVNQRVADLLLRRLGYEARIVANGVEVLAALEEETYDVIFLDVQMPELDGVDTAREISRRYPEGNRPWLIALTAHALESDREECLAAGMNHYLSKPLRKESLETALRMAYEAAPRR